MATQVLCMYKVYGFRNRFMLQYVFKHFMDSFKVGKRQKIGNLMGKVKKISP